MSSFSKCNSRVRPCASWTNSAIALLVLVLFGAVAAQPAAAAGPDFSVDTTSGVVATNVGVSALTLCPSPAGAGDWVAIVAFAQGGNSEVSFANYAVAPDGSWAGQFTIPTAAVPGAAQLRASCFDASRRVLTTVDYAPVDFEVTQSVVFAFPTNGPVGTVVDITSEPCPKPSGAGDWLAIVAFAQGGNGEVSFANYAIGADGSWGGTFTIPSAAVPGAAQLVAACFDASPGVQTQVQYAPVNFAVAQSTLGATPTSGPVGTSVGLSPTPCPQPSGAGDWLAIVAFAQGGNGEVSFANYPIGADGSWGGTFTIPSAAVPGAAQLVAACFDASPGVQTQVHYTPVDFAVAQSTLGAHEDTGPVGTIFGLSPTPCPKPAGAGDWVGIVAFAQGGNSEVSFANYVIAADGSWSGTFTIPSGAVPGLAQLNAACFDASPGVLTRVDYASEAFLVEPSTLNASPTSGPVGTQVGLSPTTCPKPSGAGEWIAIVAFAQGGNGEVSFANYAIGADGSWGGTFTIPSAAVPGNAQLVAACFDASPGVQTQVQYTPVDFAVADSTLGAHENTGPVGTIFGVSPTPCPTPSGAGDWVGSVRFAQGTNAEVSFKDYAVGPDGTWSGTFEIPSGAVPGLAHLNAFCFDALHQVAANVNYVPEAFLVEQSTLNAAPTSGPVGTQVGLSPTILTACPPVAGAGDWTVAVDFAQGGNPAVSFANFAIAADGSWGGLFKIPAAAIPGNAQFNASCFDAQHLVDARVDFALVDFLVTSAPVPTRADVAITKTAPATAAPDTDLTYKIVVTNTGPDGAANVVVADPLPSSESFVSISRSGAAGPCSVPTGGAAGGTIVCHVFSLANGASAEWDVVVHLAASLPDLTVVANTATVTADSPDPVLTNNSATASTLVNTGGGTGGGGGPPPGATPELDSLLLFGSGLSGLAAYALSRLRGRRYR